MAQVSGFFCGCTRILFVYLEPTLSFFFFFSSLIQLLTSGFSHLKVLDHLALSFNVFSCEMGLGCSMACLSHWEAKCDRGGLKCLVLCLLQVGSGADRECTGCNSSLQLALVGGMGHSGG